MNAVVDAPRVVLVDPSLFTGPYDAALNEGLQQAGAKPSWLTRPTRRGDRQEIPAQYVEPIFYKHVDDATAFPKAMRTAVKGLAHIVGLMRMLRYVISVRPQVVHIQWVVVPLIDMPVLWLLKHLCPLVLTVHDTVPFNGERMSLLQNLGFYGPLKLANRIIVHTQAGKARLIHQSVPADKIAVIPHGPLPLDAVPQARLRARDPRWTFVVFGEIKPYKGIDVLIEALGLVPVSLRAKARVIVAGRARMEMDALYQRIEELGLGEQIEIRSERLSEQEMADLFDETDSFVFPYRQIDASGVYFLVKSNCKWMIASKVGIFAEDMMEGEQGALVEPENPADLARALANAIEARPAPKPLPETGTWAHIGQSTVALYQAAMSDWASGAKRRGG